MHGSDWVVACCGWKASDSANMCPTHGGHVHPRSRSVASILCLTRLALGASSKGGPNEGEDWGSEERGRSSRMRAKSVAGPMQKPRISRRIGGIGQS